MNAETDWRIGQVIRCFSHGHELNRKIGSVLEVHPSGYKGIVDPEGVLSIQLNQGRVLIDASMHWVTA